MADAGDTKQLCPHFNEDGSTHPLALQATDGVTYNFKYQPKTMRFQLLDSVSQRLVDGQSLPISNATYTCEGQLYTIRHIPTVCVCKSPRPNAKSEPTNTSHSQTQPRTSEHKRPLI